MTTFNLSHTTRFVMFYRPDTFSEWESYPGKIPTVSMLADIAKEYIACGFEIQARKVECNESGEIVVYHFRDALTLDALEVSS